MIGSGFFQSFLLLISYFNIEIATYKTWNCVLWWWLLKVSNRTRVNIWNNLHYVSRSPSKLVNAQVSSTCYYTCIGYVLNCSTYVELWLSLEFHRMNDISNVKPNILIINLWKDDCFIWFFSSQNRYLVFPLLYYTEWYLDIC